MVITAMPNTHVTSCTDFLHMQPSHNLMIERHSAIARAQCGKPPKTRICTTLLLCHFWYPKGRWQTTRSFLPRFRSLLYGKLSYFSGAANTVPGIRTSPVIGHVTAGLLSVTACTLHIAMEGGGGMRGASKAVKKQHIPELCTGAKISEAPQIVAGSLRAKVWVGLSSPSGVLGNLESNRKSLQR